MMCVFETAIGRRVAFLGLGIFFGLSGRLEAQAPPAVPVELGLRDYLNRVLARNESIQTRLLELAIGEKKLKGEWGVFEPEMVNSVEYQENRRENSAEQLRSQSFPVFRERNMIYNSGLESLMPSGAKVRLGYTLREINNNLQDQRSINIPNFGNVSLPAVDVEYQSFFGLSATQPLLKNGWPTATMANIRVAALTSEIAYQEYRRQMMVIVSTAEAAYWNLYLAQEQLGFFNESVALAETISKDARSKLEAGKGSELEILEAESALALRRSKRADARQKLAEAISRATALYASSTLGTNQPIRAINRPEASAANPVLRDAWQAAFDLNPDYLSQRKKAALEDVRLAYAKNQRLPQLDLKGSFGLNGLGEDPGMSWNDVSRRGFPSWSMGLELHIPLAGGLKGRYELEAAKLRKRQALMSLKELETQIANAIDTAVQKISSTRDSAHNYETVVKFAQNLLDTQLARLQVGKVEARKVLETEAEVFEAKNSVVDMLVQHERALLELELVSGSTLRSRQLDLTQKELESQTASIIRHGRLNDAEYESFLNNRRIEFERRTTAPASLMRPEDEEKARQLLRDTLKESETPQAIKLPAPLMRPEDEEKARRLLRDTVKELEKPKTTK